MKNLDNKNILVIAELPVIHKGYLEAFLKIKKDNPKTHFYMGFLGNRIIKELTKLESDIRKISFEDSKKILDCYLPIKKCFLVTRDSFSKINKSVKFNKIIVFRGEKSEQFAKKILKENKYKKLTKFYDIRLRWEDDKVAEFRKNKSKILKPELEIHKKFIKKAFREIEKSKCWWRQVGAILVKNKKVIFTAFNEMMPTDDECYKIGCIRDHIKPGEKSEVCSVSHAEASIVARAANQGISLKRTTLYVTHFPCPACAKLIALSGIKTVVYTRGSSVFDGARVMKDNGIKLIKI